MELEEVRARIKNCRQEAEVELKKELKAKDEARALVITEKLLEKEIEAKIKKEMEEAATKIEINFQCHKDNVHRLKQEIVNAKAAGQVSEQQQKLVNLCPLGDIGEDDRKYIVCKTNEVSVLLLPCAHQIMCVTYCDMFEFILTGRCPICFDSDPTEDWCL